MSGDRRGGHAARAAAVGPQRRRPRSRLTALACALGVAAAAFWVVGAVRQAMAARRHRLDRGRPRALRLRRRHLPAADPGRARLSGRAPGAGGAVASRPRHGARRDRRRPDLVRGRHRLCGGGTPGLVAAVFMIANDSAVAPHLLLPAADPGFVLADPQGVLAQRLHLRHRRDPGAGLGPRGRHRPADPRPAPASRSG